MRVHTQGFPAALRFDKSSINKLSGQSGITFRWKGSSVQKNGETSLLPEILGGDSLYPLRADRSSGLEEHGNQL